jgi:hypothetical protein
MIAGHAAFRPERLPPIQQAVKLEIGKQEIGRERSPLTMMVPL